MVSPLAWLNKDSADVRDMVSSLVLQQRSIIPGLLLLAANVSLVEDLAALDVILCVSLDASLYGMIYSSQVDIIYPK